MCYVGGPTFDSKQMLAKFFAEDDTAFLLDRTQRSLET